MYQAQIQSFGSFVPAAHGLKPVEHESEADALCEAINVCQSLMGERWPKAHAGKVSMSASREYGLIFIRARHENEIYGITMRVGKV